MPKSTKIKDKISDFGEFLQCYLEKEEGDVQEKPRLDKFAIEVR